MAPSDQSISGAPLYVAEPSEPLFIQNSFAEAQPPAQSLPLPSKFKAYSPGAMLAESAFMTSAFGQQFSGAAFGNDMMSVPQAPGSGCEVTDPGAESDCSTNDTSNEAMTSMLSDGSDGAGFMMPNLAMVAENSWQSYAAPGYWMPYPAVPQPEQTWSPQMPSVGSSGHRLGRCKPCAFMYKDGCRSGADCPYCHLCPPGEKQRRKRVMRSMQRNMTPQ